MPFSDLPEHLYMPALRPFQPIPVEKDNKQYVMLRDFFALTEESIVIPPNVFMVIQQINGNSTAEEIVTKTQSPPEQFIDLLKKLDSVGLLWGPTSTQLEDEAVDKLKKRNSFPIRVSGSLGKSKEEANSQLSAWFEKTENPELEEIPKAIVAPHLDYQRGWANYAQAFYSWQNIQSPNRIIILGTNHFGSGDGVVLSPLGFETPLGTCPIDSEVATKLTDKLGKGLTIDLLDHVPEHSIELQIPWIQHCFGNVPIVAALIPSPLVEMIEDDGERTTIEEFTNTLSQILKEVGGTTYFIASADLSHVGQKFGEPRPIDEQRKFDVERHDREMMAKFIENDGDAFVEAMKWNNNATRWCSIGNMSALLKLAKPKEIELIDYRQTSDDPSILVSSCAMALT